MNAGCVVEQMGPEKEKGAMKGSIVQGLWKLLLCVGLVGVALPGRAATVEYIHTDALGSPVAVTNSAGVVIERREYEPYGKQTQPTTLTNGPGYTGHVSDAATGLDYMQQRYYDPGIGRFLSMDPVATNSDAGANFNRYRYANDNPYKFTDPDGRMVCSTNNEQCNLERADAKAHGVMILYALGEGNSKAESNPSGKSNQLGSVSKGDVGDRGEADGVQLQYRLRRYVEPGQIAGVVNSHMDKAWGGNDLRFTYTDKVGWIDFRHVAVAGSIPLGGSFGRAWEWSQSFSKYSFSSGAAEDANSNVIGSNARLWQSEGPRLPGMTSNFGMNVQVLTKSLGPMTKAEASKLLEGK